MLEFVALLLAAVTPIAVVVSSFFVEWRPFDGLPGIGYSVFALGGLFSLTNFVVALGQSARRRRAKSEGKEFHHVSPIPLFGNLATIGLILAPQAWWLSTLATVFLLVDFGGAQWFLIPLIRQRAD